MENVINKGIEWLIYVLVFYYLMFVIAALFGFFMRGIELQLITEILMIISVIILSGVIANKIRSKITNMFSKLNFTTRLFVSLVALTLLLFTLPIFIEQLPNRVK